MQGICEGRTAQVRLCLACKLHGHERWQERCEEYCFLH